jgi:hypothetical protein
VVTHVAHLRAVVSDRQAVFDRHAFYGHGRFLKNSGLSYADMERLHVQRVGDVKPERRLPTPAWAMNNAQTQQVLAEYVERRLMVPRGVGLTPKERLERCQVASKVHAARTREDLAQRIKEYRLLSDGKISEVSARTYQSVFLSTLRGKSLADYLREAERQIKNLDTAAHILERGLPALCASLVYMYYRLLWNSVTCAEELGLQSPHCRQLLARLNRAAFKKRNIPLGGKPVEPRRIKLDAEKIQQIRTLYATGNYSQKKIAEQYGVSKTRIGVLVAEAPRRRRRKHA